LDHKRNKNKVRDPEHTMPALFLELILRADVYGSATT